MWFSHSMLCGVFIEVSIHVDDVIFTVCVGYACLKSLVLMFGSI